MFFVQVTVSNESLEHKMVDGSIEMTDDDKSRKDDVSDATNSAADNALFENTSSSNMSISEI